mmetsp:Transcript_17262/g.15514  ORF Transcript_17262/g.15514 Transcript_17262/m.15514 type:complete len:171 (+) Transcript_17262:21-533(+)
MSTEFMNQIKTPKITNISNQPMAIIVSQSNPLIPNTYEHFMIIGDCTDIMNHLMQYLNPMDIISFHQTKLAVLDIDIAYGIIKQSFSIANNNDYHLRNCSDDDRPIESIDFSYNADSFIHFVKILDIHQIYQNGMNGLMITNIIITVKIPIQNIQQNKYGLNMMNHYKIS